jgi:ribosomal protein L37AE/L43A
MSEAEHKALWVWTPNEFSAGAYSCPYCDELTDWALKRTTETVYTCRCGKKFEFEWDTVPAGEFGSNLVLALTREVDEKQQ